jgi:hypothetical protein
MIEYFTAEGGLFCVPTHTWSNPGDGKFTLDLTIPSSRLGTFPSVAAADPRGVRSVNPTHSMMVFGDRAAAEEFVKDDPFVLTSTSPKSCYGKIIDQGGHILLVGVAHNRNTILHCVGEMLDLPNREKIMREALAPIKERYDYILIDCSPSLGLITVNSLTAADAVIIPVQCEYFALEGISKLLNTIKIIKSNLNPALDIEGFLLTMFNSRLRLSNQVYNEVKKHFRELVFDTVIQRNIRLGEAPSMGIPALMYDAESTGAKNYLALAEEILNRNK